MKNKVKAILALAEDFEALKPIGENGNHSLYDNALIGISYDGRLVYSIQKMIELYSKEYNASLDEAEEFLEYNCFGAYVGEMTPIYVKDNQL
jgi:hypothetical protein